MSLQDFIENISNTEQNRSTLLAGKLLTFCNAKVIDFCRIEELCLKHRSKNEVRPIYPLKISLVQQRSTRS